MPCEVLGGHERGILSRAMVVAEVLDVDDERSLSVITTPGLSEWDALGLCRYGVLSIEGPAAARCRPRRLVGHAESGASAGGGDGLHHNLSGAAMTPLG
ncbi:hypothetical protein [Streptomyces sp. NPDC091371]|uniref:hypothetical protein n=1 Tax=Streptomyces sp. NPDC091371 TaxID=3155303 RepID=UPI003429DC94